MRFAPPEPEPPVIPDGLARLIDRLDALAQRFDLTAEELADRLAEVIDHVIDAEELRDRYDIRRRSSQAG